MRNGDSKLPDFSFEKKARADGACRIAGIDEAGRGPWAGPVVAAAVILDPLAIPPGLNDSKKLSQERREILFDEIESHAEVEVGIIDVQQIDRHNILQATLMAMKKAVEALPQTPDYAFVDGNKTPDFSFPHQALVKGDRRSLTVAAASIVAKVTRDRIMIAMADDFPGYGFERHKGYGTAQHSAALKQLGPCAQHRASFAPIRALLTGQH